MSTLRKEYWDTTNQYIIEMYKRAADLYEKTAMSALADINSYNQLQATASWSWGWSSSSSGNPILDDIINKMNAKQSLMNAGYTEEQADALVWGWATIDDKGNIVTVSEADKKAAQEKLWQTQPTKASSKEKYRQMNKNLQASDANTFTKAAGNVWEFFSYITPERVWNIISWGLDTYK